MNVSVLDGFIRAETEGLMVSLSDVVKVGNHWRVNNFMSPVQLSTLLSLKGFNDFLVVCQKNNPDHPMMVTTGKGRNSRTMGHIFLAIYIAEQMSPEFHYEVIRTFVEGKLLEFRELGGTEFKDLNAAIDLYLPGREGKDNKGIYINTAKLLRTKILGQNADSTGWASASAAQTHQRYDFERRLVDFLRMGLVKDWDHMKALIDRF